MPCEICSSRCAGSRCKTCRMLDRQEEETKAEAEKSVDTPTCADCGADATGGAYAPDRAGVLLCRGCHPDPDAGRKPAGGSSAVVLTDGGEDEDGETELHVPDDDCVVMTDGGRDLVPSAWKRINAQASSAAERFDSTLLANRVHVTVEEDTNLQQVVDVVEQAYNIEDRRGQREEVGSTAFDAAELLNEEIAGLVEDAVAKECVCLLEHYRAGWFDRSDTHDDATVREAVDEALGWVQDHDDVVERAGLAIPEVDG